MNVIHGIEALARPLDRCVLVIGNFDGVHLAHRQLISQAGLFAAQSGAPVAALTFEPHPLTIVAPAKAPPRLTSI
jgi:riboflavin kinase/FMN adenylyltransferase